MKQVENKYVGYVEQRGGDVEELEPPEVGLNDKIILADETLVKTATKKSETDNHAEDFEGLTLAGVLVLSNEQVCLLKLDKHKNETDRHQNCKHCVNGPTLNAISLRHLL